MSNKKIAVVTGANGFVGSHLVDLLLQNNLIVRCITRKTSDLRWLKDKPVEMFDGGLLDKENLKKAFKDASYIYHVAGVVKAKTPEGYFNGNVETTKTLLEVASENSSSLEKFLIVSSQTVTGPSLDGKPVNENTECKPLTTYGKSKKTQEEVALSFTDKLPITICRAPAVFGERDTEIFIYFQTFKQRINNNIGI